MSISYPIPTRSTRFIMATLLLLGLSAPGNLEARDFQVAILPFQVRGNVPDLYFAAAELPISLQKTAAFLFQLRKDYPVQDADQLNRALPSSTLKGASPNGDYCQFTRGTHILYSEASFSGLGPVRFEMKLRSCNTGRVVQEGRARADLNDLQSALVQAIQASTRSFPDRSLPRWSKPDQEWVIVLDQSGSMAEEKRALARALKNRTNDLSSLRVGLLLVGESGNRLIPPGELARAVDIIEASASGGEVTLASMGSALQELNKLPRSNRSVIIFTDAAARSTASFESAIRRLKSSGSHPVLVPTSGLAAPARAFYARLNRTLKLENANVMYGMRAGFAEGFSLFFVQHADRFFLSRTDVSASLQSGRLDTDRLEPLATVNLRDDRLTLTSVIRSYANRNRLRLIGTGPILSNLEQALAAIGNTPTGNEGPKILLKNHGRAFWIQSNPAIQRQLASYRGSGRQIYVGLRLQAGLTGPVNHPDTVIIRSADTVPSLLIQRYDQLESGNLLKKDDIWFFLVEVVDTR